MAESPAARRGRPARISRERVVDAALALVDEHGIEGLTMRALARRLGVDPMAVYRHVRDKGDLLGAMTDAILVDLDPLDLDAPWAPQVTRLAHELRDRLVARPALLPVVAGAPMTPASVAIAQRAVELLTRAGVPVELAVAGFGAVFSYVVGFALVEAAAPAPPADAAALDAATRAHLGLAADAPAPAHLAAARAMFDEPGDFDLGLELLLDGLARRAATGPGTARASPPTPR